IACTYGESSGVSILPATDCVSPGAMQFTLMLDGPSSRASVVVSPIIANVVMPYTDSAGIAPIDDWFTMLPPPRLTISGTAARDTFHAPVTFTANAWFHISGGNPSVDMPPDASCAMS